ncbi:MAG: mechanosensitive ion channel family protein [Gammaproteobacteria bacterium]|nr:MAG: mechanosensitive ion channel family protein [Gammaproteobacteria bacterium]
MDWSRLGHELGLGVLADSKIMQIFVVVLLTLVAVFVLRRIFDKAAAALLKTRNLWDDTLLEAGRRPAVVLVWLLGLSWAAEVAQSVTQADVFDIVDPVRRYGVIVLMAWFLVRFISGAETILVNPDKMKEPMDPTTVSALSKLLRVSVIITTVLVVMQSMGYSISGVLAFGGIGGIAVGFAAKDLLANFFGGLMIYLDRPFAVGDWIRSPDKNIEGTVEHIGWRLTRIRTFDKRPLYVPNATFTSISVENPSRMLNRRIYETIGVRYCDFNRLGEIVQAVREMLEQHPEIDTTQTLIVNFNAFGPSSLDFFVYTFTRATNWVKYHEVKQDVLMKIMSIIREKGGDVAFPTTTIDLPDQVRIELMEQKKDQ